MISSHRTDTATLLPSTFVTAFMRALNPGTWLLNCMNSKFFDNGMAAFFNVQNCSKRMDLPNVSGGKTRIYYIAAEDQLWDYGPTGQNNIDGVPLTSPKRYEFYYLSWNFKFMNRFAYLKSAVSTCHRTWQHFLNCLTIKLQICIESSKNS